MKKLISLLLVFVLAAGMLAGLTHAEPVLEAEAEPLFDPEAIAAGTSLAPVAYAEWSDSTLNPVSPDEAQGIGAYAVDEGEEYTGFSSGGYLNDGGRAPVGAMVSFTDDDCRAEVWEVLYPEVIEPLGIPYTLSVPIDQLDGSGYMSAWQLRELVDAGVSVACHTMRETSMAAYTLKGLDAMLRQWHSAANDLSLGKVLSYAYCNGIWSDEVMPAVKSHFRMGFTVEPGINRMPFESFYMKRVGLFANQAQKVSFTLRDGTYLNANGTLIGSTPGQRQTTQPIPVKEGEEYVLTCSAVWRGACYAIYDRSGKVIEKYNVPDTAAGELLTDHKVRIPAGAATLVVAHNQAAHAGSSLAVKKLPDDSTLHAAKQYVDQVAQEGGWLIFMTHAWYRWFDAADLRELVAYIEAAGIPIVDVNEAIETSGNVLEVGTFRGAQEYASEPYFVISADGRVYTNSLELPDTPENHENVTLTLRERRVILNNMSVSAAANATEYVVSDYVDVSDCAAILVTGWAYDHSGGTGSGYQVYVIKDANGQVLDSYTARNSYAAGGDLLDHAYIALPKGAATVMVAGNIYQARPELTKIYPTG